MGATCSGITGVTSPKEEWIQISVRGRGLQGKEPSIGASGKGDGRRQEETCAAQTQRALWVEQSVLPRKRDEHLAFRSHFRFLTSVDSEHFPHLESKFAVSGTTKMLAVYFSWGARGGDHK